jgi:adenylate cyclase
MTHGPTESQHPDPLDHALRAGSGSWAQDVSRGGGSLPMTRRLAAVLSADAHGYSRLMGDDEIGTIRTLTAHRELMKEAVAHFNGRVVDSPGDNLLAEFASVLDAVSCALEIQRTLAERNSRLVEGRRLEFRVGINVGEVIVDEGRIYGDAVNVAARIEALASPGGLCVSALVHEHVASKLAVEWESLGDQTMKNIPRPVRVYRARLTTADGTPVRESVRVPADRPAIAVLPFEEVDGDAADQYFGDGLVEDIVGALASLPDLFVVSRSSASRFRGDVRDIRAIGRDLGVRYVLMGSVRRAGARLRIRAELADVETQTVLWTDKVDGRSDELFELQDRLSERTVTTLAPHVRDAEIRRTLRKRPENLDAYDYTLRGLDALYRLRRQEFDRAREMFERAIALDAGYAAAYALTATWYSIRIGQGWSVDVDADYGRVMECATAALERDPADARALALCGHLRALRFRDYDGALALFDQAVASSPNSAIAWVRSSPTYSYLGEAAEAKRRAGLALRLSPFDPHLFYAHTALALACYTAGEFEEAVAWGRRARSQNPAFTANLRFLAASFAALGRLDEAEEVGKALCAVAPGFRVEAFCAGYAYRDAALRAALARHLTSAGLPA